jgi:membrane protease YdiL (CAAX protease family)
MFLVGAAAWLSTYCHCRRSAACMRGVGFRRRGLSRDLAVGLAAGIATFSIVPVLAILCGWAAMRGGGPGGAFAPPGAVLLSLIGSCATLLPAAFAEEASTRGVPLTLVARRNTTLAVIGTSLIFAMLHAGNTGIEIIGLLDAFLGGILLAILRLRTGTLWLATGWHFGWNLAQGWLFGANISGHSPALDPLLSLRMDGPTFMVGGIYGPESGLLSILAELIAIAVTLRFVRRAAPD